ncbi:MAG: alkaline phosphatase [Arcobacter sp.]|nr:MAG: alkaline phosphatase [Arcobacter sp.]
MKFGTKTLLLSSVVIALLGGCGGSDNAPTESTTPAQPPVVVKPVQQSNNAWFKAGIQRIETADLQSYITARGGAKNIILFVGDGMGASTVTAARILEGQRRGETGEENMLSFDNFPVAGLSKTYNTNAQTPDSAGTMTAMMTGVKSKAGVLSVSQLVARANCASAQGHEVMTAIELAEDLGMSTGIVSTARITHATPAAAYAHTPERNWENDSKLPQEAIDNGCKDIASQFLSFNYGDGIDVAMGGGRREFMPNTLTDVEGKNGKRTDGRDLRDEWKTANPIGSYVETQAEFDAIDTATATKLFGLFNYSHMQYEADRANDVAGEPSLTEMTKKAIEVLSKNEKGFVLMVESGRIDHAHHAGNAYNALSDTIEMAKAVAMADEMTLDEDTLIIVTADHSHVFTIAGYPKRGNPILGKVQGTDSSGAPKTTDDLAADDLPYTTLGYTNGRGFMDLGSETDADAGYNQPVFAGRTDLSAVDTTSAGFHQEVTVPRSSETHAGEDVAIYAKGPGSQLLSGENEQHLIFHVMERMANLTSQ